MSWYRGRYVFSKRSLAQWMAESKKDYHFRVRNKGKADPTVVSFVFSDGVKKTADFIVLAVSYITITRNIANSKP